MKDQLPMTKIEVIESSANRLIFLKRGHKNRTVDQSKAEFKKLCVSSSQMTEGLNLVFRNSDEKKDFFRMWYGQKKREIFQFQIFSKNYC